MTTIRDVAKKAKVSVATISRVMNPATSHLVHPETREQVEKIIKACHYTPNQFARGLTTQKSHTLGMVTAFSTDIVKSPYYEGLIAGIIEGIRPIPYDLKWVMIKNEEADHHTLHELMSKHSVDGLIFLTWKLFPKLIQEIESHPNLPLVLINDFNPSVKSSIVYSDNEEGIKKICVYLKSKKIKKVGMLRGPEYVSHDALERYRFFKNHSKKQGLVFDDRFSIECVRFEEATAYEAVKANAKLFFRKLPDVLFCANDDLAHGAMRALKELKIQVPNNIQLIGYDGTLRNEYSTPKLTSVRQPLELMGRVAVETLVKIMGAKHKGAIQLKFEPELLIRESS